MPVKQITNVLTVLLIMIASLIINRYAGIILPAEERMIDFGGALAFIFPGLHLIASLYIPRWVIGGWKDRQ